MILLFPSHQNISLFLLLLSPQEGKRCECGTWGWFALESHVLKSTDVYQECKAHFHSLYFNVFPLRGIRLLKKKSLLTRFECLCVLGSTVLDILNFHFPGSRGQEDLEGLVHSKFWGTGDSCELAVCIPSPCPQSHTDKIGLRMSSRKSFPNTIKSRSSQVSCCLKGTAQRAQPKMHSSLTVVSFIKHCLRTQVPHHIFSSWSWMKEATRDDLCACQTRTR